MNSFRSVLRWAMLSVGLMLVACNSPQATEGQARQVVDKLYAALKANDYDAAAKLFDPQFFQRETKDAWLEYRKKIADKLGPLQEIKVKELQINTIYSGRQFLFVFVNHYEKGNATETLVLMQPVDKPDIHIVAHKIDSMQL